MSVICKNDLLSDAQWLKNLKNLGYIKDKPEITRIGYDDRNYLIQLKSVSIVLEYYEPPNAFISDLHYIHVARNMENIKDMRFMQLGICHHFGYDLVKALNDFGALLENLVNSTDRVLTVAEMFDVYSKDMMKWYKSSKINDGTFTAANESFLEIKKLSAATGYQLDFASKANLKIDSKFFSYIRSSVIALFLMTLRDSELKTSERLFGNIDNANYLAANTY